MLFDFAGVDFLDFRDAQTEYGQDTGGAVRTLRGAFVVHEPSAIPAILARANREGWTLWPFSGGRNFGYGTALPVHDQSYLLDLSQLKGIDYYPDSHTFRIQPGVNQRDLVDYLDRHGLDYLVPTTGVGPNGSILGNALDGGYGLTPIVDHFESLSAIAGYWGNGTPFTHAYQDLGCDDMARRWPPGTGPAVTSLLRQGNLAVVTQGTVRLIRRPEATRVLILEWESDQAFFDSQA
jgi:FAD/FMN-containing dehydrogenase